MTEQLKELKLTSNLEKSPDSTPIKVRQGESLGIDVKATYNNKPLQIPVGATCVLRVWTAGTTGTLYINKTGTVVSATKGKIRIELLPEETNFTAGEYKGEIRIVHSESGSDSNIATAWYGDFVVEEANTTGLGGVGTFAGLEMADIDDFSDSGKMDQYVVTYNQSTDSYILAAVSLSGTVTSVAVSGSDGIEVDSGSPITGAGTIALGVDASAMKAHLDLEIGTDVQAYNAKLDSIAGLTPGDEGKMIGSDGLGGYQIQTASETRAYLNVEDGATADQSDAEIETAYNNQVDVVGQAEAEAGISTTVRRWTAERVAQAIAALGGGGGSDPIAQMRGVLNGLVTSINVSDSDHDIDIAPGAACDDTTGTVIELETALTKQIDAAWSVGDGGGLDTGTVQADTDYHYWLIQRSDTGVVDFLFSLSATSPTMPTNYDRKCRIGACWTDGSANLIPYIQNNDEFLWSEGPIRNYSASPSTTSSILITTSVPTGIKVMGKYVAAFAYSLGAAPTDVECRISSPDQDDVAPVPGTLNLRLWATDKGCQWSGYLPTNTSGQVRWRQNESNSNYSLSIYTEGWIDPRGKNG